MPNGRIAIADDHAPTREVLDELLRLEGWTVLAASDGVELLRIACAMHLDAVVTDLSMPRLDGLAVARQLRAHPATAGLLLVAITADALTEEQLGELETVFDLVLRKPIHPTELRLGLLRLSSKAC